MSLLTKQFEELTRSNEPINEGRKKAVPERAGWGVGIPSGGATQYNQAGAGTDGTTSRQQQMEDLLNAYLTCTWVSASIDTIARTATAGGLEVIPKSGVYSDLEQAAVTDEVKKVQELLNYVNPYEDSRQLMRNVVTSLQIFGDAFIEVVWSRYGEPVALYTLDARTMNVLADEHGNIQGYYQENENNRQAFFTPRDVIHIKFDTPGDTLYGASPTEKAQLPITIWLYASTLLKETMRRGDPLRLWFDWPIALPESERRRFQEQFHTRNLGPKNIGNPVETKGGATVKELGVNQIQNWMQTIQERRDEIISSYGVPPSNVGIIEAGNIGGGTGTSQEKMFRVNTIGPVQELILEKLTFHLLVNAYGVKDWELKFGVVDWRDDETIENIRDLRIRNGSWTLDRARADIGEPRTPGGDKPVLIDRQNMVLWEDLNDLSKANLAIALSQANPNDGTGTPNPTPKKGVNAVKGPNTNPKQRTGVKPPKTGQRPQSQAAPKAPSGSESIDDYLWEDDGVVENDD